MERFVFQVIEPLISKDLEEDKRQERVKKVIEELRAFVKGELVPINKQLAKKARELFVASSDNQNLKQNVESLEREAMKLRSEVATKQTEAIRQRVSFDRQSQSMREQIEALKKEQKRLFKKNQNDIQKLNNQWKDKLIDVKRQLKAEYASVLQAERKVHEDEVQHLKTTFSAEKQHLIHQNSSQKSKIIKKYEEKLFNLRNESEYALDKVTADLNSKIANLKQNKTELVNKLTMEEMNVRNLTMELERETTQHGRFKGQFQSIFRELEQSRERNQQQKVNLIKEMDQARAHFKEVQKKLVTEIKTLKDLLKQTIEQKDNKFTDTVDMMNTQHRIEVDSLRNNMMQQKQIALNTFEVKSYQESFQQVKKYQRLQAQYNQLEFLYQNIKEKYEKQIQQMQHEHELELNNLQERKEYEREVSGQNAKKQFQNLQNKYNLEIRSLKAQQIQERQNQQKKFQEDKIVLTNKLTAQYQGMLSDQRSNTEIQLKQKYVQSQRKAKAYEKGIIEAEKRKADLKVAIERMKIESQMKIESLMEVNQKLEVDIEDLHQKILDLQKSKSSLINDYEYQLLLLKNEIQKIKEDSQQREDDLRANLNERIVVKNKEMAKFAQKLKVETDELIRRNRMRTNALQKEYEQLKRVINERTSLPEDIEALKVFHGAYLQKENELIAEKKKRQQLQRQLQSKDAIDKVFVAKESFKRLTILDKMGQLTSKQLSTRGFPSYI